MAKTQNKNDLILRCVCAAYAGTVFGLIGAVEIGRPDPQTAEKTLREAGLTKITIKGRAPLFKCSGFYKTAFEAVSIATGERVQGNVCQLIGGKPEVKPYK